MQLIPARFFARNTDTVARALLGAIIVRDLDDSVVIVRIVETEAYTEDDPASHSYRGRTKRNSAMFGPPGHAYVYLIYGVHHCFNVVTECEGKGAAVLVRAAEPVESDECTAFNRERNRTNGPGKLCRALEITRDQNGLALFDPASRVRLYRKPCVSDPDDEEVTIAPRVGITLATDRMRRYYLTRSRYISRRARKNAL